MVQQFAENTITNNIPAIVCRVQQQGTDKLAITYVNAAIFNYLDITVEDCLQNSHLFFELMDVADFLTLKQLFALNSQAKVAVLQQIVFNQKNGIKSVFQLSANRVVISGGLVVWDTVLVKLSDNNLRPDLPAFAAGNSYLFSNSPAAMFVWDFVTKQIIDCNEAALIMYEYEREEFLQLNIRDIRPAEDLESLENLTSSEEKFKNVASLMHTMVWRHFKKSGQLMQVQVTGHIILVKGRKAALVLINDITRQFEAEEKLRLSEQNYRNIFELSPLPMWIYDFESYQIFTANQSATAHYGYSKAEFLNMTIKQLRPLADVPALPAARTMVKNTDHIVNFGTYNHLKKNGTIIKVNVSGSKIIYNGKRAMIVVSTDITLQQNLLETLADRNQFIENILKNLPIGIAVNRIDDGKATIVNDNFSKIYGWPNEEIIDVPSFFKKVYPNEGYRNTISKQIVDDIKSGDVNRMQWPNMRITTNTGEERFVNAKNIPLYDQNLMISIVMDVTKEARQEADLLRIRFNQEALINSTNDLIWSVDKTFRLITANRAYITFTEMATGHNIKEGDAVFYDVYVELNKRWKEYYNRALNGESFSVEENSFNPLAGRLEYGIISFNPMYDSQKKIFGVACHSKNITEVTNSKIEIENAKNELEKILSSSLDVICTINGHGQFITVSKASYNIWGYTPKELEGTNYEKYVLANDVPKTLDVIRQIVAGVKITDFENRYRHKNGQIITILWSATWDANENLMYCVAKNISEQKRLSDLLNVSNKLARIGSWEYNLMTDHLYWSEVTREIHEVDNEEEIKMIKATDSYKQGEHRNQMMANIEAAVQQGKAWDTELIMITQTGNEKWIRTLGKAEFANGKCIRIFGSTQDIHQRKIAELGLLAAFEERNTILESIGDAFFSMDNQLVINYWNNKAEEITSRPREAVLGTKLLELLNNDTVKNIYNQYKFNLDNALAFQFETFYPPLNIWIEASVYPAKNNISVYFKDVTTRHEALEQLRVSNDRFEKVSAATNDAIWDWDIKSDTGYLGGGFKTYFGYEYDLIKGALSVWKNKIHPNDYSLVIQSMNEALNDVNALNWHGEYRYKHIKGHYLYIVDRGLISRNNKGEAIRMVGAMTDITYRKEYEASLKALNQSLDERARQLAISNEELEQFAYVASHDLQEPLRMITSFLTQLNSKYESLLDEKGKKYIFLAVDGARRMRQIILDLLEYSRVGRVQSTKVIIDLHSVQEQVCHLLRKLIDEKKAKIISVKKLPLVNSFSAPVTQVLHNLIGNALKYSRQGVAPIIYLDYSETDLEWVISVKDNGIGIEEEYFEKIFVIFQRLHGPHDYGGTGLGLAIVKKIIDTLGGRIWLTSKEGEGSTFYFSILK